MLPVVTTSGKVIMSSPCDVQLQPNGNGALFEAISTQFEVHSYIKEADYVQVIGVDNILNKLLDPLQIGFMKESKLEASLKACVKKSPEEKVGVVCKKNGKYDIVEYSELSDEQAKKTADNGSLYFELGSILIFMLDSSKLLDLCSDLETLNQLYHYAFKKIPEWNQEEKQAVKPSTENAYKFELFLHNFLPFCNAGKFGVLSVDRNEEFGPVKNANGASSDTPDIAKQLFLEQHKRWIDKALDEGNKDKFSGKSPEVDLLLSYAGEGDLLK